MRGFSLIELMVVVVIISIITAIQLPALLEARKQAQKVSCRVAVRSYATRYSNSQGKLVVEIPQEANCHECHKPRYNARLYLDTIEAP